MNLGAQCSTVDTTVTLKEDIHLPWTQLGSFENHYHKVGKGSQLWEIRAAKECNHNNILIEAVYQNTSEQAQTSTLHTQLTWPSFVMQKERKELCTLSLWPRVGTTSFSQSGPGADARPNAMAAPSISCSVNTW